MGETKVQNLVLFERKGRDDGNVVARHFSIGMSDRIDLELLDVDLIVDKDEVDYRALVGGNLVPVVERVFLSVLANFRRVVRVD